MTRADVLSYRGNGQPAAPNKTLRASLHLPTPRTGFILTFMQATLANSKKKIAFDILTVVRCRLTAPTPSGSSLMSVEQWGN